MGGFFIDTNGKKSSKRLWGAVCIVAGIVITIVGLIVGRGAEYSIPAFSAGTLLLGAGTLEKPKE